jgi:hypothetical protein
MEPLNEKRVTFTSYGSNVTPQVFKSNLPTTAYMYKYIYIYM